MSAKKSAASKLHTQEQLELLLKLVHFNSKKLAKNFSQRQKIWQIIVDELNTMDGAKMDVEAWKSCYQTHVSNTSKNYVKELERVLKRGVDDAQFEINLSDDNDANEGEVGHNAKVKTYKKTVERQTRHLNELIEKHKDIIISNADDQPLKEQVWLNITEELNAIPNGLQLTTSEWKERVDWSRFMTRKRGPSGKKRKSAEVYQTKMVKGSNNKTLDYIEFEVIHDNELPSASGKNKEPHYSHQNFVNSEYDDVDELSKDNDAGQKKSPVKVQEPQVNLTSQYLWNERHGAAETGCDARSTSVDYEMLDNDIEFGSSGDYDYDEQDNNVASTSFTYEHRNINPTPLVKTFKYKTRMSKAMTELNSSVNNMNELLKNTASCLTSLTNLVQQQCEKQDITNALLKRNARLLKILVESQSGNCTLE